MANMSATKDRQEEANGPELSVVIVVGGQRQRAAAALRSLLDQRAIDRMEILLFDLESDECPPLAGSENHRVRTNRCGPKFLLGRARAEGVRTANAPVVAFLEEHCLAQPGWAEAMILAHRGPWAAVGCEFMCANPNSGSSDKTFRMTYGAYVHAEQQRGPVTFVAGQNSAFKRDVLLQYDEQLEMMMIADLVLQWKMMEDGYRFFHEPAAMIAHRNENTVLSICPGAFYWNWCFANVRAQVFEWSFGWKALRIALAPLIPWARLVKKAMLVAHLGRRQFLQFLCDIPSVLVIDYCGAAGQVAGLFNKIDIAARKFSHFEMNEPRLSRSDLVR
jgi:hypothetical protein